MPAPPTGRRSALFDRAQADWRWHLVFPGAQPGRRPAPSGNDGIQERHRGAALRGSDVGWTDSRSVWNLQAQSAVEQELIAWLVRYGAPILFLAQVLGIFGLPIPDEMLLTLAGALVRRGTLPGVPIVTSAIAGCL